MHKEGAPEFRPRREEKIAEIEGKIEKPFVDIELGKDPFEPVGSVSLPIGLLGMEIPLLLYTAQLEFQDQSGQRHTDLSATTAPQMPILFSGTNRGFYAYSPRWNGRADPFYIVGIQPDELRDNVSRLSAVWHELGHILIGHSDLDIGIALKAIDTRRRSPAVRQADAYIEEVAKSQAAQGNSNRDRRLLAAMRSNGMTLFHERNAWAAGARLVGTGLPSGFQESSSYFQYARLCLSTYAEGRRDPRFVKGFSRK